MKRKSHRAQMQRALYYVIPVIVALAIAAGFSLAVLQIVREETRRSNYETGEYFTQNINDRLISLETYTFELINTPAARTLSSVGQDDAMTSRTVNTANELKSTIYNFCTSNDLVDDVIFYYPKLERTVSKIGYLTTYQYFLLQDVQLHNRQDLYQQRADTLLQRDNCSFFSVYNELSGETECYFYRRTPIESTLEDQSRAILLRMDPEAISSSMEQIAEAMDMQYVAMVSPDGRIFAWAGDPAYAQNIENAQSFDEENYTKIDSSVWGMTFYFLHDRTNVYKFVKSVSGILLSGLLLAAAVGVALALFNYRQREKALYRIKQRLGGTKEDTLDHAVNEHLERTYQENLHNIKTIDTQRSLIKQSFLKELLCTKGLTDTNLERICAIYDIDFENDSFSVFAIVPLKTDMIRRKEDMWAFLYREEFKDIAIFWTSVDNIDVFLCNYDRNKRNRQTMELLKKELPEVLPGRLYGSGTCISSVMSSVEEFYALYRVITGRDFTLAGRQTDTRQNITQQFIEAIRQGSMERAREYFPQLSGYFASLKDENQALCQKYSFLNELYRMPQLENCRDILDGMCRDMVPAAWELSLQRLLDASAAYIQNGQSQEPVATQAVRIISEEYMNPQMSLSMLAERLDVSQEHLSRAFKQKYGENISRFLSKVRIEHAKELMKSGNSNLNTIALSVGFISDMNFIRVFKKLENETPGSYRKMQSDLEN